MAAQPQAPSAGGRLRAGKQWGYVARPAKLTVRASSNARRLLDQEGWDSLTIAGDPAQARGRRCTTTWTASGSRRAVRIRVIDITMLNRVSAGRLRDDAVLVMAGCLPQLRPPPPGSVLGVHPDAAGR